MQGHKFLPPPPVLLLLFLLNKTNHCLDRWRWKWRCLLRRPSWTTWTMPCRSWLTWSSPRCLQATRMVRRPRCRRCTGATELGASSPTPPLSSRSSGGKRSTSRGLTTTPFLSTTTRSRRRLPRAGGASASMHPRWVRVYPGMARLSSWLSSTGSRLLIQDTDAGTTCISTMMSGARPRLANRSSTGLILVRGKM